MTQADARNLKVAIVVTIIILLLLISMPAPAFSQGNQPPAIQNLVVNSGFEGGFQQDFGIGYGWGGFSNGNAVVGWNADSWAPVVSAGKYSQSVEIKDALSQDRYAGIYQTISVVPGEQYKLTIKGLIRSDEGSISLSDYGYRAQYAIDYEGGTAWELLPPSAWQELPWDEQPLANPDSQNYEYKTFETTITAQGDKLTLFIRGWKKWINKGTGIFNFDEISFVGPAPAGFQAPVAQAAAVANPEQPSDSLPSTTTETTTDAATQMAETEEETQMADSTGAIEEAEPADQVPAETDRQMEAVSQSEATSLEPTTGADMSTQADQNLPTDGTTDQMEPAPLPVSGLGSNGSVHFVLIISISLLLILLIGAIVATLRQRNVTTE
jgi:hypothetical protein